jgi:hypothetical protein
VSVAIKCHKKKEAELLRLLDSNSYIYAGTLLEEARRENVLFLVAGLGLGLKSAGGLLFGLMGVFAFSGFSASLSLHCDMKHCGDIMVELDGNLMSAAFLDWTLQVNLMAVDLDLTS